MQKKLEEKQAFAPGAAGRQLLVGSLTRLLSPGVLFSWTLPRMENISMHAYMQSQRFLRRCSVFSILCRTGLC